MLKKNSTTGTGFRFSSLTAEVAIHNTEYLAHYVSQVVFLSIKKCCFVRYQQCCYRNGGLNIITITRKYEVRFS